MKFYLLYIVAEWHITRTVADDFFLSRIRRQKFKLPHRLRSRFRSLADMETKAFSMLVNRPLSGLEQAVREIHFLQWWSCEWAAGDCGSVMPYVLLQWPLSFNYFFFFFIFLQNGKGEHIKEVVMALRELPSTQDGTEAPPSFCHPGLHRYFLLDKWLDLMTDWHVAATHITKEKKILLIKTKETLKQRHLCESQSKL